MYWGTSLQLSMEAKVPNVQVIPLGAGKYALGIPANDNRIGPVEFPKFPGGVNRPPPADIPYSAGVGSLAGRLAIGGTALGIAADVYSDALETYAGPLANGWTKTGSRVVTPNYGWGWFNDGGYDQACVATTNQFFGPVYNDMNSPGPADQWWARWVNRHPSYNAWGLKEEGWHRNSPGVGYLRINPWVAPSPALNPDPAIEPAVVPEPATNPNIWRSIPNRALPEVGPREEPFPNVDPNTMAVTRSYSPSRNPRNRGNIKAREHVGTATSPKPTGRGTKEAPKQKLGGVSLADVMDWMSEGAEVVDAFYQTLPDDVKKRWGKDRKKRGPADQYGQYGIDGADWKLEAMANNFDKIDWTKGLANVLANEIEDRLYGAAYGARDKVTGQGKYRNNPAARFR